MLRLGDGTVPELRTWLFPKLSWKCGLGGRDLAARHYCSLLWELDLAGSLCLSLSFYWFGLPLKVVKKIKCARLQVKRIEMWKCNKHIVSIYYVAGTMRSIKNELEKTTNYNQGSFSFLLFLLLGAVSLSRHIHS